MGNELESLRVEGDPGCDSEGGEEGRGGAALGWYVGGDFGGNEMEEDVENLEREKTRWES